MRKIVLNDGKEYEINQCGQSEDTLWIGFPVGVIDFADAVSVFMNKDATIKIISTYHFDGMETVFEGFTDLIYIKKEYEGGILLALRKEKQNGE